MIPNSNPQKEHQHTSTVQKKQRVESTKPDAKQYHRLNHNHLNQSSASQSSTGQSSTNQGSTGQSGLNNAQQHFVLKFCRQLASVIQACEHSETAEIEVGRRQIGVQQVRVKLRAERELQ